MEKSVLDERWLGTLGESGYRITAPRRLIVRVFTPAAPKPDQIYDVNAKSIPD
jgi:hypothetical protein